MYQPDNSNDDSSLGPENLDHNTDNSYDSADNDKNEMFLREQDRFLPIANISRIMKKNIPSNGKISKEAKELVQECVSEFISFITSEASDRCKHEKRKTINGEDLIFAMATLGFDNFIEPLKLYLMKYRDYSMHNAKDLKNLEAISNGSLQQMIHNNSNNNTNDSVHNNQQQDNNNHHNINFSFP